PQMYIGQKTIKSLTDSLCSNSSTFFTLLVNCHVYSSSVNDFHYIFRPEVCRHFDYPFKNRSFHITPCLWSLLFWSYSFQNEIPIHAQFFMIYSFETFKLKPNNII